jgi:hypothetical protein
MSMIKVTYSSDISSTVGVGGEIVKSASELGKQASTIFKIEYDALKPPEGMTGIHLVALGDSDAYPMNRNGDLFTKAACEKYYPTFVKHGHVFEHHRNKDPKKSIGQIKAAAYNADMHRVELYIWADNAKAHDHLERLEKTGETAFSMACRVPRDRCSVCNAMREKPGDESECDHIKYSLGKIAEDGTQIGTYNDDPTWFDISFVGRPADRIAWNLKVASAMPDDLSINSSVKQAEIEGYSLPDDLAIESDSANRKLEMMKKLANSYGLLEKWLFGGAKPSGREAYTFELRKLAGARLSDGDVYRLRELHPSDAFAALGDAGVVLDAESFFKYAFGPTDYGIVEKYVPYVENATPSVIKEAVDTSSCAEFCNDSRFDARPCGSILSVRPRALVEGMMKSSAANGFWTNDPVSGIMSAIAEGTVPEFSDPSEKVACDQEVDPSVVRKLARQYAMYKVAALCAVMDRPRGMSLDEDDVVFVSAAQDMRSHK